MTKISIIVPVYKAENYLHKCIESLLVQTFSDFELLLINDGSPDHSGLICDQFATKDTRIRVFHKDNGGVSSARQYGMDNAIGEYIIHADPDDWVEPTMLEELYNKAISESADMVICDFHCDYIKAKKTIYIKQKPSSLDAPIVLKELFLHLHGSCCNKLVKKECFDKYQIKFPLELSFCEDLYVNATLLKENIKVTYLPKAFYHYIQDINENSLVTSYNRDKVITDKITEKYFCNLLKETEAYLICKKRFSYIIVNRAFTNNCFNSKEFKQLFYEYKNFLLKNPNLNFKMQIVYYLSCIGFYGFIRKILSLRNKN